MNFAPYELETAHSRLTELRKQAAQARLARSAKPRRRG
jgi:hypothetical protein